MNDSHRSTVVELGLHAMELERYRGEDDDKGHVLLTGSWRLRVAVPSHPKSAVILIWYSLRPRQADICLVVTLVTRAV